LLVQKCSLATISPRTNNWEWKIFVLDIEANAALSLYMPSPADERSRLTIVTKSTTGWMENQSGWKPVWEIPVWMENQSGSQGW